MPTLGFMTYFINFFPRFKYAAVKRAAWSSLENHCKRIAARQQVLLYVVSRGDDHLWFHFFLGRCSCHVVKAVSLLAVYTPLFCSIDELWSFRRVFENNGDEIFWFSCFWCVTVLIKARSSVATAYFWSWHWLRGRFDYVSWCNVIYPLMHVGVDTLGRAQARSVENTWHSVVGSGLFAIFPTKDTRCNLMR